MLFSFVFFRVNQGRMSALSESLAYKKALQLKKNNNAKKSKNKNKNKNNNKEDTHALFVENLYFSKTP